MNNEGFFSKIRKNPILSFLVFTFLISWIIWILAPIIADNVGILSSQAKLIENYIIMIGSFGPSLAAIFVSAILNPLSSNASRKKRYILFFIVWTVLSVIFFINFGLYLPYYFFSIQVILLLTLISAVAAYVISSVYHPNLGVVNLLKGLKQISPKNVWLWIAFLFPFAFGFLAVIIDLGLGGTWPLNFNLNSLGFLIINYLLLLFRGGSLNEEPGWRGFLVPNLQKRFNPFKTGLIIGLIWMLWHFPLHFNGVYPGGIAPFLLRFFSTVPFGILFTWLYNRSKGNLFACILLHTSINSMSSLFGPKINWQVGGTIQTLIFSMIIVFTIIVIFYDKMFKKIQNY